MRKFNSILCIMGGFISKSVKKTIRYLVNFEIL